MKMGYISFIALISITLVGITKGLGLTTPRTQSLLLALRDNDTASGKLDRNTVLPPEIQSLHIHSNIRYRYCRTQVTSRVVNVNKNVPQEITFRVVLPDTAFISKFIMEIDCKSYEAFVKEKKSARKMYATAKSQGNSAALVQLSKNTRDSQVFDVNVHIKTQSEVTFDLTYEELLSRRQGRYQQSISFSPDQVLTVKDFQVIVNIEESQNITLLRVPPISDDMDAGRNTGENMKEVVIERQGKRANVTWKPSVQLQRALTAQGQTGKLVVEYDIFRELDAGEVLLMNGYFVHFFAPTNLRPLRKHVVFVLDVSGSMKGRKMDQLKEAMNKILEDLNPRDFFNIIEFSTNVNHWDPCNLTHASDYDSRCSLSTVPAIAENIRKAQIFITGLVAEGGTNIHGANMEALKLARKREVPSGVEPMIIFLTDGVPTEGITSLHQIKTEIKNENTLDPVPLFSLAFGSGADFEFVKQLSLQNNGVARKIYEDSDATIQLTGFYSEISSPLLSNVTFNYVSTKFEVANLTATNFPTYFEGSEIAVSGALIPKVSPGVSNENQTEVADAEIPPPFEDSSSELPGIVDFDLQFIQNDGIDIGVSVAGTGDKGHVVLDNPKLLSSNQRRFQMPETPISVFPRSNSCEPTPTRGTASHPTRRNMEDAFLEKLWAYLTIKQLLDEDLASTEDRRTSNDSRVVKPLKQKALRLALKYGFVSPLTSLVVIKPNQTVVADNVPIVDDLKPPETTPSSDVKWKSLDNYDDVDDYDDFEYEDTSFDSRSGNVSTTPSPQTTVATTTPRLTTPPATTTRRLTTTPATTRRLTTTPPVTSTTTPQPTTQAYQPVIEGRWNQRLPYSNNTPTPRAMATETPLPLDRLTWFRPDYPMFEFYQKPFRIAVDEKLDSYYYNVGYGCRLRATTIRESGTCQHLRDCVQLEFATAIDLYRSTYFCRITSSRPRDYPYAGVCCLKRR